MSASRLRALQEAFADAVLAGDAGALAPQLDAEDDDALRRVAIYRRSVLNNLVRALRGAYPVALRLVGDAFFDEAARQYAPGHPPSGSDLNRYGADWPAFLERYPYAAELPWLPDVTRLEWAVHEASMAGEGEPPDFAALAQWPVDAQPGLRFALRPSVRLVRSAHPVLAIWEANQPGRDGTPGRLEGADDVLVWREDGVVRAAALTPREADFIAALAAGRTLGEAIGEPDWDVAACLQRLARHGALGPFAHDERPGCT